MDAAFEYIKQNGFPAVCLAALCYYLWRASNWFAAAVAEPLVTDIRALLRAAGGAALKVRDDIAEVKEAVTRIEQRQDEHLAICARSTTPAATPRAVA